MNHSADATCIPVENAARFFTLRRHTPAAVGWKTTAGLFHASGRDT